MDVRDSLYYITQALTKCRYSLHDELILHGQLADSLTKANIPFTREYKLGPRERVDFLCESGVAIEVKISGRAKDVYRQLERYSVSEEVKGILLVTSKRFSMPGIIGGKPCGVISLTMGWL